MMTVSRHLLINQRRHAWKDWINARYLLDKLTERHVDGVTTIEELLERLRVEEAEHFAAHKAADVVAKEAGFDV